MGYRFDPKVLILFSFLLVTSGPLLFGQKKLIEVHTSWNAQQARCIPCGFDPVGPGIFSSQAISLNDRGIKSYTYQIKQVVYEKIGNQQLVPAKQLVFKSQHDADIRFETARGENYLVARYNPIIEQNGELVIVSKMVIEVETIGTQITGDRAATFASTSVLASGFWYKIGVTNSGIHKMDAAFLGSLGITTSGLNPNHINIYGNHTPKLPTQNSTHRPDDLLKNSIYIEGGGDGSFDASDYILFYATGPDVVTVGGSDFAASRNNIDTMLYYFIHIDASDAPQRITSIGNSADAVTHTVNSGADYFLHENDNVNLLKSGDGWYGEHFDIELTHNFSADLGSVKSGTGIKMTTAVASTVKSGTASLSVVVNGTTQDVVTCSLVTGSYTEAKYNTSTITFNSAASTMNFNLSFQRSSAASEAWLDYILLNYERNYIMGSNQLHIRNLASVGSGNTAAYTISNTTSSLQVWEVTAPWAATKVNGSFSGSDFLFTQNSDSLRTYISFYATQTFTPIAMGSVSNQNLHALPQADYILVSHASFMTQAERLADLHRDNGLDVHVIELQKVYNEFSSGVADPVAVRWLMKMFYDRAAGDPNEMPKYLCLFGDGTYDPLNRVEANNYLMPTYNSEESGDIDFISSYTADDFFGFLDDLEGMSAFNLLDIGVGRIPVTTLDEAEDVVNKIEHYMKYGSYLYSNASGVQCNSDGYSSSFGDWRNRLVLMADDQDNGQFVNDCEALADSVRKNYPEMNVVKIYLDAYQQVVTSGGQRYPEVEEAINQNINKGALVFNYVGHGGETGLSLERVVTVPMIQAWTNINNLTMFISATCEFSRYDDPNRVSAGETILLTPLGGAVSLMTTTRLVQVSVNTELVQNLYTLLFDEINGEGLALGEILRQTKNLSAGSDNIRSFTLLGDPALQLGKPQPFIVTDSINGVSVAMPTDTLKALSKVTFSGHIEDVNGNIMTGYNGIVYPTIYDKWKTKYTLGQDTDSPIKPFQTQNNIIYKGKATVTNGYFEYTFVVPKDIDYAYGRGKASYYSQNTISHSYGYDTSFVTGGVDPDGINDAIGPVINLYMNDENFANGGITNSRPLLIAEISDENGINTTGNGIGHDITVILDGNTANPIVLNNFYEADLDTYQSGKVTYQFTELSEGEHTVTFKVWDVNNNSSEQTLEFVVVEEAELGLSHVLNYPNPFTTYTEFYFEHNQCCSSLEVKVEIFTVSGKLVKTLFETVNTIAYRNEGIAWDGRDDYGDKLARGVYVYRISVKTAEGLKAEKVEKLVIL
ncbi:MAG: type IX secretion system sortase PorU [Crocinitomicaceae bacterium]|nr:type IX secretion system sortase PorU [Crocinitomicaceae bacterium]MBK8926778.1 type IX secretion system sortase PorU [Crocinitomicaceae bacterium]